ncbi:prepilin-type N-terminal cleavage/methylation domain-containing protein [Desulfosarcina ovata]|uniref:Prepilin-type N-terminal cleavage/methylation domain-containing protein n=2 Tax=Desulfosarcina ovata TaxID=83564 RepID=A0A5K8ALA5_9BACT|nr:prepilin-type N-terminal cleavage/methylation domain-containing protein [Desulfosarcina ovata]BBO86335.1 hypothetical protein DSCO28_69010 [Desulfosarcina ovata subsp. sediminis]BBO93276.1 hypothetical protein DSCOOX_64560 [Desulfosarcina ovata subsp. ovata]
MRFRREDGFTLLEILVALAITAVVSVLIVNMFTRLSKSYMAEKAVSETQQELRRTMERITLDIRNAGFDPKREADAGIEVATATQLRFTQDIDYNITMNDYTGTIDDDSGERITYQIDTANNRLLKIADEGTASQSSRTVLENINPADSSFSYLDGDGATLSMTSGVVDNPGDIRSAIIALALQNNAGWGDSVIRDLTAQVKFRNIGLN